MDPMMTVSSSSMQKVNSHASKNTSNACYIEESSESTESKNLQNENHRKMSYTERQQLHSLLQQCTEVVADDEFPLCFQAKRHQECIEGVKYDRQHWRIRERMKTASVALVLCLNIGVDPPDVVKVQPCSKLECWIDPTSVSPAKAMDMIGANLQAQYERWQPRARYKKCHDPTVEDVKKLCTSLRRNAKGERILFHYNGHGVPKPTANGEIWVFNKSFTQYIPLSIFELQNWMTAPSIYVYDCSNAGIIIQSFLQFAEQQEREMEKSQMSTKKQRNSGVQMPTANIINYKNCIHLAACSINEILPMNAQLPADLFTSCLTTPINIALQWHTMRENFDLTPRLYSDFIDKIPGKVNDRRTMMGELNWVFTAITDTIAWNILPRELFQRLFRQDLLVASLFRNFLLAERILRSHNCTPVSHPSLPQCFRHHMWTAWDLVVDLALRQLPDILERGMPYKQLPFFEEQLTAFQVWLDREAESRNPPEQLPIVLQVLLSQVHRLRALELLARFLDLGPWAVNQALGVGIFPYVLKLLQSSARELRPVLVFIWAKILAIDPTCQVDLVKEHKYFLDVLQDTTLHKKYRTLSAFVLACIVNNFLMGQSSALQGSLVSICLEQLNDDSWLLRQWLAICLGKLWQNFEKARWSGVRDLAHEKLYTLLKDPIPEVRAAAVYALGTFISSVTDRSEEHANKIDRIIAITLLESAGEDMSPLVRGELAAALQWMVLLFESQFVAVYMQEHMFTSSAYSGERSGSVGHVMAGAPISASTFYKLCNRWRIEVDKNPQTFDNVRKFLKSKEMLTVLRHVQSKIKDFTLNVDHIRLIYTICAYETAWRRHKDEPSVWCQLFDEDSFKILEFAEDLEYYWNDGYGYELTTRIACPAIADLFKHIDPQSSLPNATFYFTHSGTLLKIIAHLGLYKDEFPLTYNVFSKNRNWRTSFIDSFATNLVFVLYECDNNKPMILTMHQERIVQIPGCPKHSDLCSLETMREIFWHSIENCNFNDICTIS